RFIAAERFASGIAAKPAKASQPSKVPVRERKQCQPPSDFWCRRSLSIDDCTDGWSRYPNRVSMRTALPVKQTSLFRPPRSPDGPPNRRRNSFTAFTIRGWVRRTSRSERTRRRQFVATYFGRYSSRAELPAVSHWQLRARA